MAPWRAMMDVMILGNPLGSWLLALGIFLVTFTLLPLLRRLISAHRRSRENETLAVHVAVDLSAALAERTSRLFLFGVAVWLASHDLVLDPRVERGLTVVMVILFWM